MGGMRRLIVAGLTLVMLIVGLITGYYFSLIMYALKHGVTITKPLLTGSDREVGGFKVLSIRNVQALFFDFKTGKLYAGTVLTPHA